MGFRRFGHVTRSVIATSTASRAKPQLTTSHVVPPTRDLLRHRARSSPIAPVTSTPTLATYTQRGFGEDRRDLRSASGASCTA